MSAFFARATTAINSIPRTRPDTHVIAAASTSVKVAFQSIAETLAAA